MAQEIESANNDRLVTDPDLQGDKRIHLGNCLVVGRRTAVSVTVWPIKELFKSSIWEWKNGTGSVAKRVLFPL
jgi:hypothetical protein